VVTLRNAIDWMAMKQHCAHCGGEFEAKRASRRFCSDKCRINSYKAGLVGGVVGSVEPHKVIHPHQATKDFEKGLCEYTGATYAVAVNSCSMAILLACAYWAQRPLFHDEKLVTRLSIPKRTYVSVPMSIKHAGWGVDYRDEDWRGSYQIAPLAVWDCARRFTGGMYKRRQMQCVSFHWSKILGIQQGGAILHDSPHADAWFRRARLDGRTEGVPPHQDNFDFCGWHCYMSPEVAQAGIMRLSLLAKVNADLPNDNYPDLSRFEALK